MVPKAQIALEKAVPRWQCVCLESFTGMDMWRGIIVVLVQGYSGIRRIVLYVYSWSEMQERRIRSQRAMGTIGLSTEIVTFMLRQ